MKMISCFLLLFMSGIICSQTIEFEDVSSVSGLKHVAWDRGIAIADYDGDGDEDIYVSCRNEANRLYRNLGNLQFEDVSEQAGANLSGKASMSVFADFDNDGDQDIYAGMREGNDYLLINNGDGTFEDQTETRGILNMGNATSVLVSDVNNDGWLDIYLANPFVENALFLNDGAGHFSNVILQSGALDKQIAMGSIFFDYDNDGDQDLYLTHDANDSYILYQNDGNGVFTDVSVAAGVNYAGQGMGADVGDCNNDGWMDLYITNLFENVLYLNNGDGTFSDISESAQITDEGMGWGTAWSDFDNDHLVDIYLANDSKFSPFQNVLYKNNGDGTFTFANLNDPSKSPYAGYGTACSDLNGDGLVDILVANSGDPGAQLFRNLTTDAGNWIAFSLEGTTSNRNAIGSRVEIQTENGILCDQLNAGSGFGGQNGYLMHFGLGAVDEVQQLKIYWPSGSVETFTNLSAGQKYEVTEGQGIMTTAIENDHSKEINLQLSGWFDNHDLHLKLESSIIGSFDIQLSDVSGKIIFTRKIDHQGGLSHHMLGRSQNLVSGEYLLSVLEEGVVKTLRIMKPE